MYITHNEGKSFVFFFAERFIRTLKNKIDKYMTQISKNACINKLYHIFNKYNNTYQRTVKIKSLDVKLSPYINFSKRNNKKYSKLKVSDYVRTSKYNIILAKFYVRTFCD